MNLQDSGFSSFVSLEAFSFERRSCLFDCFRSIIVDFILRYLSLSTILVFALLLVASSFSLSFVSLHSLLSIYFIFVSSESIYLPSTLFIFPRFILCLSCLFFFTQRTYPFSFVSTGISRFSIYCRSFADKHIASQTPQSPISLQRSCQCRHFNAVSSSCSQILLSSPSSLSSTAPIIVI